MRVEDLVKLTKFIYLLYIYLRSMYIIKTGRFNKNTRMPGNGISGCGIFCLLYP